MTLFSYGTLLGPAQVARHMRNQVSAHQLSLAFQARCLGSCTQGQNYSRVTVVLRFHHWFIELWPWCLLGQGNLSQA
jgi:hypothetical protein